MSQSRRRNAGKSSRRELLGQVVSSCTAVSLYPASNCIAGASVQEQPQRIPSIHDRIRAEAASAPLRMQFRGSTDDECQAWQREFRGKLLELLGNPAPPKKWTVVAEATRRFDNFTREDLILNADGLPSVPLAVLKPTARGNGRAILCVHGHGAYGHEAVVGGESDPRIEQAIAESRYDYARQLVQHGYITIAPCLTPFGRRLGDRSAYGDQDPCAITFIRMQLLGRILMGENLRDLLWAIEYIRSRQDVDPERIGCVGLSYGGRMTMLTAAVSPHIQVAVVSGALNVMQERITGFYSCGAQVIPGLLEYGDIPEIGSLIAPRPCLWEIGKQDTLIDPVWAQRALDRMSRAYSAFQATDQLRADRFDGGHRWNGIAAVPLLKSVLITKS